MPFNVLLLPLLGGYFFISRWNRTRFQVKRHSNQRLLFDSALAGAIFLGLAYATAKGLAIVLPSLQAIWRSYVPFAYAGTSLLALGLGVGVWWPLNRWLFRTDDEAKRAIVGSNDYLELLLFEAVTDTKMVLLALKGGKVYVGMILRNFDPAYDRKHVSVLPFRSGYRRDNLTVEFTTDYARVYQKILDKAITVGVDEDDFQIVIPVSEIETAHFFDANAYREFVKAGNEALSESL